MKMKAYSLLVMALLVLSVMPLVLATGVGTGVGVSITTEKFEPLIWMCDNRVFTDDTIQPQAGVARVNNYAFEGESISWTVLVMDKNKIEEISEVVGTVGSTQGVGNDVEVECKRVTGIAFILPNCNARIGEESLTGTTLDAATQAYYDCRLTVETEASMHGPYFITVEAKDLTGLSSIMDENEFWFLNPTIALSIDGTLEFNDVRPGTDAYSQTLLVGNDAEADSGVVLDMFVSGTDFYDPSSSGAACPTTNQLALANFRYFATNGAFTSAPLVACGTPGNVRAAADAEGYVGIARGERIDQACEIMGNDLFLGAANPGNTLTPGSEIALTFKLSMPEPCVGDFSEGQIYFWGEAI